jgi:hypothetical protein
LKSPETTGRFRKHPEPIGNFRKHSEGFGNIREPSETHGKLRKHPEAPIEKIYTTISLNFQAKISISDIFGSKMVAINKKGVMVKTITP